MARDRADRAGTVPSAHLDQNGEDSEEAHDRGHAHRKRQPARVAAEENTGRAFTNARKKRRDEVAPLRAVPGTLPYAGAS